MTLLGALQKRFMEQGAEIQLSYANVQRYVLVCFVLSVTRYVVDKGTLIGIIPWGQIVFDSYSLYFVNG